MGVPIHNPVRGNGVERRSIAVRFFPNGASAADAQLERHDPNGDVASVLRTAQGTWQVILNYGVQKVLSMQATVQHPTAADLVPQFGSLTNEGTADPLTFVVRANAVATATDITGNANASISLQLELELSSVAV
jgi:hypothetical protein